MPRGKNHVVEGTHPVKAVQQLNTRTDEEKIIAYLNSDAKVGELSEKLEKLLKRYDYAFDIYRNYRSINKTLEVLIKKEWPDGSISRRTARRDLQMAIRIFSDGTEHDRKTNIDFLLGEIKTDIDLARVEGDYKAVARLREIELKIINDHMGDNLAELYKNFSMPELHFGNFPEKLKTKLPPADELAARMEALKKKRVSDTLEAEDVTYSVDGEQ